MEESKGEEEEYDQEENEDFIYVFPEREEIPKAKELPMRKRKTDDRLIGESKDIKMRVKQQVLEGVAKPKVSLMIRSPKDAITFGLTCILKSRFTGYIYCGDGHYC